MIYPIGKYCELVVNSIILRLCLDGNATLGTDRALLLIKFKRHNSKMYGNYELLDYMKNLICETVIGIYSS